MKKLIPIFILLLITLSGSGCANYGARYINYDTPDNLITRDHNIYGETAYVIPEIKDEQIKGESLRFHFLFFAWGGTLEDALNKSVEDTNADGIFMTRRSVKNKGFLGIFWTTTYKVYGKKVIFKPVPSDYTYENDLYSLEQRILRKQALLKKLWKIRSRLYMRNVRYNDDYRRRSFWQWLFGRRPLR